MISLPNVPTPLRPLLPLPIALALLLVFFGVLQQTATVHAATTRNYPGAAPCNTTLQACITAASAGDTILIAAGEYFTDELLIHQAITLSGAGPESTIFHALTSQRLISVSENLAEGVTLADLQLTGAHVDAPGGALYSGVGTPLTLEQVYILDNALTQGTSLNGGGAYIAGPAQIGNSIFARNSATDGSGGGIYAEVDVVVTNSRFELNRATFGGGLRANQNAEVVASTFITNSAGLDGGGAFIDGSYVTLTASSFVSNTAAGSAGGLWAEVNATVSETHFISNSSGATAGGLQINGGTGVVTGGSFVGNESGPNVVDFNEQGGGALYQSGGHLTIANVTFAANRSATDGGALAGDSVLHISGSHFVENEATMGGGVMSPGLLFITSTTFLQNRAEEGGGVVSGGIATISNSHFISNTASQLGGALASSGDSRISATRFEANVAASGRGGALWFGLLLPNGSFHDVTIDRTFFVENIAAETAGAIWVEHQVALTLTNSLLVGNSTASDGFAIDSHSRDLQIINATLYHNSGGGIRINEGAFDLANSILWENGTTELTSTIPLTLTGPNIIEGGLFGASDEEPRFVAEFDPVTGDLGDQRLSQFSPAIDRGDAAALPASFTLDLDNGSRRVDIAAVPNSGSGTPPIDLGAFEVNNQFPVAEANGPYTGNEGSPVALDAGGSGAGSGQNLAQFAWDCTSNGDFESVSSQPTGASCTYADQGTFTVTLRVTDTAGLIASDVATLTVENVAPALSGQSNQNATQNLAKSFTLGAFGDPGADAPWQVTVDWGDGQSSMFTANSTGALPNTPHTFTTTGVFTATVTMTDKDDENNSAHFTVTVAPDDVEQQVKLWLPLLYK